MRRDHHAQSGLLSSQWGRGGSNHCSQISALSRHCFKTRGDATSSQESVHHNEVWRCTVKYNESDSSFITARRQKFQKLSSTLRQDAVRIRAHRSELRQSERRREKQLSITPSSQKPPPKNSVISETKSESLSLGVDQPERVALRQDGHLSITSTVRPGTGHISLSSN